jgi:Histone chaperone domain CHZ
MRMMQRRTLAARPASATHRSFRPVPAFAAPEEIQKAKVALETQRELEGIDARNIVSGGRRRGAAAATAAAAAAPAPAADEPLRKMAKSARDAAAEGGSDSDDFGAGSSSSDSDEGGDEDSDKDADASGCDESDED